MQFVSNQLRSRALPLSLDSVHVKSTAEHDEKKAAQEPAGLQHLMTLSR